MTAKEYYELLQLAKDRKNWTPALFKEYQRACIEMRPCIFNKLRKILSEEDYKDFDLQYCSNNRPEVKRGDENIKLRYEKEEVDQWKQKQTKKKHYKVSPKSNFLLISKELGFQLETME